MFKFGSKPVQITGNMVLCQDGSIWQKQTTCDFEFIQIAEYEKPATKQKPGNWGSRYTDEFENFWNTWNSNIKNSCGKGNAFIRWQKLSVDEKKISVSFIIQYSKSNSDHQYLKRADTYLSQKIWESADQIEELTKSVMLPIGNIAWSKEIYNQDTGITDSARAQVERFGMPQEEAWRLLNDS